MFITKITKREVKRYISVYTTIVTFFGILLNHILIYTYTGFCAFVYSLYFVLNHAFPKKFIDIDYNIYYTNL